MGTHEPLESRCLFTAVTGVFYVVNDQQFPLTAGVTLPANTQGIVATGDRSTSSIAFRLDGQDRPVESSAPYSLYGDEGGKLRAFGLAPGQHGLRVTPYGRDKAAGTRGTAVTLNFTFAASPTPTPTPTPTGDAHLFGAGDIAGSFVGDNQTGDLMRTLLGKTPGAIPFTLGDNVYERGTASEYQSFYSPSWGSFANDTYAALGNHEWLTNKAQPTLDYFPKMAGRKYYSFKAGTWRVYVLNSNDPSSTQLNWLKAQLAANGEKNIAAFWHHATLSDGDGHGSDPVMRPFWAALDAAGADLIGAGHNHVSEFHAPATSTGAASSSGVYSFVAGLGGKRGDALDDSKRPTRVYGNDDDLAVAHLRLGANDFTFEFIGTNGNVLFSTTRVVIN